MKKLSIRKILAVSNCEYRQFIFNPRNIVVLSMYIVFYDSILKEFYKMSQDMGEPINLFEPFIALCGTGLATMLLPIVYLIIISDFPKIQGNVRFYIVRTGKLNWLLGQLLFSLESAATYMITTLLFSILTGMHMSFWGKEWSNVVTKYYIAFPDKINSPANNLINGTLYNQVTTFQALFYTFTLFFLMIALMGFIQMIAFVFSGRKVGMIITAFFVLIGEAFTYIGGKLMWYFPVAHIMTWRHFDEIFNTMYCEISTSYWYFTGLIAIALAIIFVFIRFKDFDEVEE